MLGLGIYASGAAAVLLAAACPPAANAALPRRAPPIHNIGVPLLYLPHQAAGWLEALVRSLRAKQGTVSGEGSIAKEKSAAPVHASCRRAADRPIDPIVDYEVAWARAPLS